MPSRISASSSTIKMVCFVMWCLLFVGCVKAPSAGKRKALKGETLLEVLPLEEELPFLLEELFFLLELPFLSLEEELFFL